MSIQSEINRISGNVSDSLDAVAAKGVTVPSGSTSDNLPSLIAQIQVQTGIKMFYGTCSTAKATASKTVTIDGITALEAGLTILVKFQYANSASNPTLQVNSLTAKPIYQYGTTAAAGTASTTGWQDGSVVMLVYDGTGWLYNKGYNSNTTYSGMTVAEYEAGTSTTDRLISPSNLKSAIEYYAVQSDWEESDSTSSAYIQNKPDLSNFKFVTFANTSAITTQVDALPSTGAYWGSIVYASETGLPSETSGFIYVYAYNANFKRIFYLRNGSGDDTYMCEKKSGTWQTWVHLPSRSEIDSITTDLGNKVPTSRTVNGKALSSNISLAASDIAHGNTTVASELNTLTENMDKMKNVTFNNTSDIRTQIDALPDECFCFGKIASPSDSYFPTTTSGIVYVFSYSSGQKHVYYIPNGDSDNVHVLWKNSTWQSWVQMPRRSEIDAKVPTTRTVNSKALSADITLAASDVGAVPTSRTVNSKALSSNITLAASDILHGSATVASELNTLLDNSTQCKWVGSFSASSDITTQVDALGEGYYFGKIATPSSSYFPTTTSGTVYVFAYNANYKRVYYEPLASGDLTYMREKKGSGRWENWVELGGATSHTLSVIDNTKITVSSMDCYTCGKICQISLNGVTFSSAASSTALISGAPKPLLQASACVVAGNTVANTQKVMYHNIYIPAGNNKIYFTASDNLSVSHYIQLFYITE